MRIAITIVLALLISSCSQFTSGASNNPSSIKFSKNYLLDNTGPQNTLTWDKALTASILLTPNYTFDQHINAYIRVYHHDVWRLYKNSPLLLVQKQKKIGLNWIASYAQQDSNNLILETSVILGDYNVDQQAFPVQVPSFSYAQQPYHYKVTRSLTSDSSFPTTFYFHINNLSRLKQLALAPDLAALLLVSKTQADGLINRQLPISILLNINQVQGSNGQRLAGNMTAVTFYPDASKEVPLRIDIFSAAGAAR
ncbi:MAG: hypothetical protein ACI86X_000785 [Moritella sp.]|jgi:hypothetical protein